MTGAPPLSALVGAAPAPEALWDPALHKLFEHMVKSEASDLYLTAGSPPVYRIDGVGYPAKKALTAEQIAEMAQSLLGGGLRDEFAEKLELNLAVETAAGGRFRVNLYRQRGAVGIVVRLVKTTIKSLVDLRHPPAVADVMSHKRGLVLVVGGTGSGKSTTLAAMIDHRNATATGHIITVEDPIEFIHPHKKCIVSQREVGIDTRSYKDALKNALRQAPDVILIGEIRDEATMEMAIAFAETGHLCLATLHANNANQAIERVLNFFPPSRQHEIRLQLSLNLRAILSQRLVPSRAGGRAAALEILLDTPRIKDLIKRGEIDTLKDAMEQGENEGCCTFDQALYGLVMFGTIDEATALANADSPNNLRLRIDRLKYAGNDRTDEVALRLVPLGEPVPAAHRSSEPPLAKLVR